LHLSTRQEGTRHHPAMALHHSTAKKEGVSPFLHFTPGIGYSIRAPELGLVWRKI